MDNTINLYGGDYHITNDGENAYIVKKGVSLVEDHLSMKLTKAK